MTVINDSLSLYRQSVYWRYIMNYASTHFDTPFVYILIFAQSISDGKFLTQKMQMLHNWEWSNCQPRATIILDM